MIEKVNGNRVMLVFGTIGRLTDLTNFKDAIGLARIVQELMLILMVVDFRIKMEVWAC